MYCVYTTRDGRLNFLVNTKKFVAVPPLNAKYACSAANGNKQTKGRRLRPVTVTQHKSSPPGR